MKAMASIGSFLRALLLVLLAFICTGNSFKQELWLYDDAQDNGLHFQSHVADTSHFTSFLPYVTRACARGVWYVFSAANFETYNTWFGSQSSSGIVCENFTSAATVKSLRHVGANDTDTDALSLYKGNQNSGKEIFVTARAYTGITNNIYRIAITGASDWMVFEGQALDGKSACFKRLSGYYVYRDYVSSLNLKTIGSVFKGCDLQEIKNYKMLQSLSL